MFVKPGARDLFLHGEREKFLAEEWPRIAATIERLGLTQKELEAAATRAAEEPEGETLNHDLHRSARSAQTFGTTIALDGIDLRVEEGRILGLIGPNGAGKTTALNAILGLTPFEGELEVLGRDPWAAREQLMREVCFIADVAVLPRWMRVSHLLDYVAGVHPRFDRAKADGFLARTEIKRKSKIRQLSKGMVAQLHLALVMAIDARLLVLDEPTLGLDILYRKQFYDSLLNDYFDRTRTIVVTDPPGRRNPGRPHRPHVHRSRAHRAGVQHGKFRVALPRSDGEPGAARRGTMRSSRFMSARFLAAACSCLETSTIAKLAALGETRRPSIADVFVAVMGEGRDRGREARSRRSENEWDGRRNHGNNPSYGRQPLISPNRGRSTGRCAANYGKTDRSTWRRSSPRALSCSGLESRLSVYRNEG